MLMLLQKVGSPGRPRHSWAEIWKRFTAPFSGHGAHPFPCGNQEQHHLVWLGLNLSPREVLAGGGRLSLKSWHQSCLRAKK